MIWRLCYLPSLFIPPTEGYQQHKQLRSNAQQTQIPSGLGVVFVSGSSRKVRRRPKVCVYWVGLQNATEGPFILCAFEQKVLVHVSLQLHSTQNHLVILFVLVC